MNQQLSEIMAKIKRPTAEESEAINLRRAKEELEIKTMRMDRILVDMPEKFLVIFKSGKIDEGRISPVAKKYVFDKAWKNKAWLLLAGSQSGKGKSFDAAWVLWNYVRAETSGFIWTMPERMIQGLIKNDGVDYHKSNMVVVDDFDKFYSADQDNAYKKNLIHEVIEYRMTIKILPTILTANADREMLEKMYTPYIIRRIWDATEGYRGTK